MDKRKLTIILLSVIGVSLFIWIQFSEVQNQLKISREKLQQDPETHDFSKVVSFEEMYMGDASNLNGLFNALPLSEYKGTIEMDPDVFSLIVNYETPVEEIEEKVKQTVIYNATAAFTLIDNLDIVNLKFEDKTYTVTRDYVEKWFGTTLIDFKEPEVFKEKVQNHLKEDLDLLVMAYTEGE